MALSDSLIAYFSLEETGSNTRVDATGRGNDLSSMTGSPSSGTGIINTALSLNGSSAISRADTADLSVGTRDFEVCFWMNPSSLSGTRRQISKDNTSTSREYVIRTNGTKVESFAWSGGTLSSVIQNTTTLSTSTWYFINWYFTSATKKMALRVNDANEISTTLSTTAIDDLAAALYVGASNGSGEFANGMIDELGFWARNLTSAERTDLYNSGAGRDYTYIAAVAAAGTLRPMRGIWGV